MRRLFVVLALIFTVSRLGAHPHMFIDTRLKVGIQDSYLQGVEVTWYFDPAFTASISEDFDANGNGKFEPDEVEQIRQYAFSNLSNYNYFTYVMTGAETYVPQSIEGFSAFMVKDQLAYRFYVPFGVKLMGREASIAIYDDTFYCDILYHVESPVRIESDSKTRWEIVESQGMAINYEGSISVSREGKSYSGTAYPQQLVVKLQ